ncbi:MAG: site-specific DNA-methyltransferase, partial [Firmicutes bacterium]|nr:site-specific DNA-methyltransferase [Bacillota bacterium]
NAHTYPTKVPHKAIVRYLLHYTRPGDVIYDAFAGTGMTGIAASLCADTNVLAMYEPDENSETKIGAAGGRKTILSDLSPAASFISHVLNNHTYTEDMQNEIGEIITRLEDKLAWVYETNHSGRKGKIIYVVWSDVYTCPSCLKEIIFYNSFIDSDRKRVKRDSVCEHCGTVISKSNMERVSTSTYDPILRRTVVQSKQVPVAVYYSEGNKKRLAEINDYDMAVMAKIDGLKLEDYLKWCPTNEVPLGYNTAQPINSHGFTYVHHFYTLRNLIVLSQLSFLIDQASPNTRSFLKLVLQSIVSTLTSKLVRYNLGNRGNGVLPGTLYVSSLVAESNVIEAFKGKVRDFAKAMSFSKPGRQLVSVNAAQALTVDDNTIDYIFTDPPFGGNIMYSELNFFWESWLRVTTNNQMEAIVNKNQGKGLVEYQRLMEDCFREYYRILKPGRWMTVVFSNSQASIWNVIQEAIQRTGFIMANVSALDKKQGSFKAVTTTTAVKQDLVISAYKPTKKMINEIRTKENTIESAWTFVRSHLRKLPTFLGQKGQAELIVERTPRVLFDRMVAYHVQNGYSVPISSAEFQEGVAQRFPMRDGMAFLETQVIE